jgi:hypothetical protein
MNLVSGVYWASFRSKTLPKFASLPQMQKIPSKIGIFIHFKTFLLTYSSISLRTALHTTHYTLLREEEERGETL